MRWFLRDLVSNGVDAISARRPVWQAMAVIAARATEGKTQIRIGHGSNKMSHQRQTRIVMSRMK